MSSCTEGRQCADWEDIYNNMIGNNESFEEIRYITLHVSGLSNYQSSKFLNCQDCAMKALYITRALFFILYKLEVRI